MIGTGEHERDRDLRDGFDSLVTVKSNALTEIVFTNISTSESTGFRCNVDDDEAVGIGIDLWLDKRNEEVSESFLSHASAGFSRAFSQCHSLRLAVGGSSKSVYASCFHGAFNSRSHSSSSSSSSKGSGDLSRLLERSYAAAALPSTTAAAAAAAAAASGTGGSSAEASPAERSHQRTLALV